MSNKKQKKILILANNDVGLYKFRKELIQELMKLGFEVHIALPFGKSIENLVNFGCIFHETPLERRGMNPLKDTALFLIYKKLIRQINPHMVITYTIKPNIYGGMAARLAKNQYAVNITGLGSAFQRDSLLRRVLIVLYRIALKKVKVVFFENTDNQQTFLRFRIINEERTCVLSGAGVNLDEYPFTPYPKESGDIRFLFIGRIMYEKGVDELFEVAKQIKKEYPNVFFDFVGPMEDNYTEIIHDLSNESVIEYYGYQEDVRPFIARSHCVVLPSHHEGMSNTLLEAGAMGRPLIASDIPGCREVIKHAFNGYVFEIGNVNSLLETVRCFIKSDYEFVKLLSKNSRCHIAIGFSKKTVIENTLRKLV